MRLLRYLFLFVVAIGVIAFAVANRQLVRFVVDPLGGPDSLFYTEIPLFALLFGAVLFGFAIGSVAAWFGQARWRNAARKRAKEIISLQKDNERLTRHLRIMERTPQIQNFNNRTEIEERPLIH